MNRRSERDRAPVAPGSASAAGARGRALDLDQRTPTAVGLYGRIDELPPTLLMFGAFALIYCNGNPLGRLVDGAMRIPVSRDFSFLRAASDRSGASPPLQDADSADIYG